MTTAHKDWHDLLACPIHHDKLDTTDEGLKCPTCHAIYPVRDSVVHFLSGDTGPRSALVGIDGSTMVRGYREPSKFVSALRSVVSSEYYPGTGWRDAKKSVSAGKAPYVVIGSGTSRYPGGLHLDIDDFPGVDLVGTAESLPFLDGSLEGALSEVVLEHVERPDHVIAETFRVLKPGGRFFFIAPFLFPFHGHPSDYRRWSKQGLAADFDAFTDIEIGIYGGPCSAMVNLLTEWCYVVTGLEFPRGYTAIKGLATLLLFPFKFIDALVNRFPEAHRLAATMYVTGRKPGGDVV
ncbi:MAG: methyltransferase domain-containing protein [Candidatus Binatia bacterium]|nr:methyltransferase domain-containing protein [Candidatus Binatia bacterium]